MKIEHTSISKEDYRLQAVTTIARDWKSPFTNTLHKKGTPLKSVAIVPFKNGQLTFGLPNMTALFIDYSYVLSTEASEFLNDNSRYVKSIGEMSKYRSMYPKSEEHFFDLLQRRMGAIIFAFSALEAFANEVIPDDFIYERLRDDGRCTETYNKNQIEKALSLDIKLSEILPKIMNVSSPKNKKLWNKYKIIKELRDRIIHIKTEDRKSVTPKDRSIWKDILSEEYPNFGLLSYRIISYYYLSTAEEKIPRWFKKFPFLEEAMHIKI